MDKLTDLVPVVLGFLITISGILKLQNSVDLLRLGHGTWHVAFALAIINIVFGVVLLINPFAKEILITLVGIGFVYSGATDLYVTISISRKLAHVEEELLAKNFRISAMLGKRVLYVQASRIKSRERQGADPGSAIRPATG
ncbi:MAG: hypothetical protein ACLSG9_11210 [Eubacterium sp.]